MSNFLHVAFRWHGPVKAEELEPTFNAAEDWLRYAPNCWILWTKSSAQEWHRKLKPFLSEKDHMFICRLDMSDRQGWLPQWIWDWMNKSR